MSRVGPRDAMALLSRPDLIGWACDPLNPAFHRANACTRDAHGRRVCDYLSEDRDWPRDVRALLCDPFPMFVEALGHEPVLLTPIRREGRKPRLVAIPTYMRRCMSNLLNDVLTRTCNRLLPRSVRAYRKGDAGAVREAILDLAEAVVEGEVVYFSKLDLSAFFPSMPWPLVEEALTHYGFVPEFIEYTMATVRCRIVRRHRGRLHELRNDRGAQMGLAESSFLANMVPFAIDEYMAGKAGKLFYLRYSDDLILGSGHRHEVVGAARFVQNWCRRNGLSLKGASPDVHPHRLVHDVRRTRIEFLGAEIDQNGVVHLPATKLKDKLADLQKMQSKLAVGWMPGMTEHVEAVSRYGDGEGVDLFDTDDIHRSIDAFVDYWMALDEAEARHGEAILKRRFPLPPASSETGCGTVWSAKLWADQAVNGEETTNPIHLSQSADPGCPLSLAPARPLGQVEPKEKGDPSFIHPYRGEPLDGEKCEEGNRDLRNGAGPHSSHQPDGGQLGRKEEGWEDLADEVEEAGMDGDDLYTGGGEVLGSYPMSNGSPESTTYIGRRFDSPSRDRSPTQREERDLFDHEGLSVPGAAGDTADGGNPFGLGDESPVPPCLVNGPIVHVAVAAIPDSLDCKVGTVTSDDGLAGRPQVRSVRGCNPETAIVLAITALIREAHGRHEDLLHVGLADAWLPKLLVQERRRIRSPLLLRRVLIMHHVACSLGVRVVITGPVRPPWCVERAIDAALVEGVREKARLALATPYPSHT